MVSLGACTAGFTETKVKQPEMAGMQNTQTTGPNTPAPAMRFKGINRKLDAVPTSRHFKGDLKKNIVDNEVKSAEVKSAKLRSQVQNNDNRFLDFNVHQNGTDEESGHSNAGDMIPKQEGSVMAPPLKTSPLTSERNGWTKESTPVCMKKNYLFMIEMPGDPQTMEDADNPGNSQQAEKMMDRWDAYGTEETDLKTGVERNALPAAALASFR